MTVLLPIVAAIAAFAIGWIIGSRRAPEAEHRPTTPEPTPTSMFADVLERHPMGVVVASEDGSTDYRNPAASALGGTHVGVLIDDAVAQHLRAARSEGISSETIELFGPPKRVVVVTAEPLPSGRAVAFVEDVTERVRADQARTDFVANVSHELRTPIGALLVLAETLEVGDEPDVVERVVTRMEGEAERAARIVDDLLELSEIEAGPDRDSAEVSLADVVADAVVRAIELAARREITVSTEAPDAGSDAAGPPMIVLGDRRQLGSAVGNMVENAVKYSDPGAVVTVLAREADGWGEIAVSDEGVGIPREDLDRVFERFYRVDRARSRSTGGTGLGLSIVRHVAHGHGGTISVESVEGQGTTFVLRLPLVRDRAGGAAVSLPTSEREGVA